MQQELVKNSARFDRRKFVSPVVVHPEKALRCKYQLKDWILVHEVGPEWLKSACNFIKYWSCLCHVDFGQLVLQKTHSHTSISVY